MIRLDRREREIAQIALFANTPYSLCRALEESSAVRRMIRSCTPEDLAHYYDRITARARRSEVDVGLAYAVLVALLSHGTRPVDAARLRWGLDIEDLLVKSGKATQQIVIGGPLSPGPSVQVRQQSGRPLPRANRIDLT